MNQELLVKDGVYESTGKSELSVQIDNERLKHFFYMLHGEPTTRTRALHGAVLVSKGDICSLVKSLRQQLTLVHVTDASFTVSLGFDKDFIEKSFDEFANSDWEDSDKTQEVIIRLHFMYEDLNKGSSIKNSVFIRIAKGIKPGNIFQMLASSDMDGLDKIEDLMCPVFCRTDNINDKLSKDLLGVVEEWHSGQKQPNLISGSYKFFKKHKGTIARFIHYIIPAAVVFILSYFAFVVPTLIENKYQIPTYVSIIVSSKLLLSYFLSYGANKAKGVYSRLSDISHQEVIFDITKGDDKEHSEVINKNQELFSSASKAFLWVNFQAIGASLLATAIFEYFKL
ncbi:MAG: hypothetical protein ABJK64_08245 [Paraglaciecola sp.]|uniref:hypothetical protein n=1 Tax=Paraglaciecola sp. TaxID=1920173 RepID=UPI0032999C21